MHMDVYVFFISLYLLHMFQVLSAPIIRSTNCRVQPYVCMIVMVCEKLDNPLEQVLAGTPSHFQHGQVWTKPDHAESVRVFQPEPAPIDYPTSPDDGCK
jgi:hypothetical protein